MQQPLITIIVPVYQVMDYLHRCVDSILAQDYQNFELILIDDGSPDKCGLICDEYAKQDARISVIHQENQGLSMARNVGLSLMKGDYVTFIDSDDYVAPDYLSFLFSLLSSNEADLSICGFYDVYGETCKPWREPNGINQTLTNPTPDFALIDGNRSKGISLVNQTVIKGDEHSASIAAASILAKVARDCYMEEMAERYPQYEFDRHKGYPTKRHYEILRAIGPCPIHRKTFLKKL